MDTTRKPVVLRSMLSRFEVEVVAARNLDSIGLGGRNNPYSIVLVGSERVKSDIVKNTVNPEWGQVFEFELFPPCPPLKCALFDSSPFGDQPLGQMEM